MLDVIQKKQGVTLAILDRYCYSCECNSHPVSYSVSLFTLQYVLYFRHAGIASGAYMYALWTLSVICVTLDVWITSMGCTKGRKWKCALILPFGIAWQPLLLVPLSCDLCEILTPLLTEFVLHACCRQLAQARSQCWSSCQVVNSFVVVDVCSLWTLYCVIPTSGSTIYQYS